MRAIALVVLSGCGFQLSLSSDAPVGTGEDGDVVVDADPADAMPEDPVIDAAPIDAALVCPPAYDVMIASTTSKYRFKKTGGKPGPSAADCANDGTGTHIVSLDSFLEIQHLHAAANATSGWAIEQTQHPNDTLIWVGGVQLPNQNEPEDNWITVSGEMLPGSWAAGEANDFDQTNNVEDNEEQLLVLWLERAHLGDIISSYDFGVICECDGLEPASAFSEAFSEQD